MDKFIKEFVSKSIVILIFTVSAVMLAKYINRNKIFKLQEDIQKIQESLNKLNKNLDNTSTNNVSSNESNLESIATMAPGPEI